MSAWLGGRLSAADRLRTSGRGIESGGDVLGAAAARRFRSQVGEVDIVARRGPELLFVEVKARHRLDDAALSVTPRQQRRIVAAAEAWLADHPDDATREISFDVILVARSGRTQHITAAFDASP